MSETKVCAQCGDSIVEIDGNFYHPMNAKCSPQQLPAAPPPEPQAGSEDIAQIARLVKEAKARLDNAHDRYNDESLTPAEDVKAACELEEADEKYSAVCENAVPRLVTALEIYESRLREVEQERDATKDALRVVGRIYFYGGFKAETVNERELEQRLRKLGCFYESEEQLLNDPVASWPSGKA